MVTSSPNQSFYIYVITSIVYKFKEPYGKFYMHPNGIRMGMEISRYSQQLWGCSNEEWQWEIEGRVSQYYMSHFKNPIKGCKCLSTFHIALSALSRDL